MRKPVCLAVVGISIVVAAGSLGVILTRYLGLLAYSPKGTAQAATAPAGPTLSAAPPEEWNNLFAPRDGMKMATRLAAVNAKTASQAQRTRFILVGTIVSSSPASRRAILWADGMKEPKAFREKEEIEPGAILASDRARQGVDHAREGAGKTGDPARGKPYPPDGGGSPDRRSRSRPRGRDAALLRRNASPTRSGGRIAAFARHDEGGGLLELSHRERGGGGVRPAGTAQASPGHPTVTARDRC